MKEDHFPVMHTDAEWRAILTPEQYDVMRGHGTERPGSCALLYEKRPGVFACAACGQPLFEARPSSRAAPAGRASIRRSKARSRRRPTQLRHDAHRGALLALRSHLGHVFPDGPPPTGLRYCINGVATNFTPAAEPAVAQRCGAGWGVVRCRNRR